MRRWLVIAAFTCAACPATRREEAPLPVVRVAEGSSWKLERGGTDPAFSHGEVWVFFTAAADGSKRIPGITIGDAKGPRYGLMGGYFAPQLGLPESDRAYALSIATEGSTVSASFGGTLIARVGVPREGRLPVVLEGAAVVFAAADRAEVRTTLAGAPASALSVTAGEPAGVSVLRADALQIESKRAGAITIATTCPRPRLIRPVPRGSTSVFAVGLGPLPGRADPLYGVETADDAERCPPATTSTVTLPVPGA